MHAQYVHQNRETSAPSPAPAPESKNLFTPPSRLSCCQPRSASDKWWYHYTRMDRRLSRVARSIVQARALYPRSAEVKCASGCKEDQGSPYARYL
jgi:hypothetical protein